jgi:hypothetical protein
MTRRWLLPCLCLSLSLSLCSVLSVVARAEPSQPPRSWLHTREVHALLVWQDALWAATSGGIERYTLPSLERTHHLTAAHGLDQPEVFALSLREGRLTARTAGAECSLSTLSPQAHFHCEPARTPVPPPAQPAGSLAGSPITSELHWRDQRLTATRGAGVWVRQENAPTSSARKLTPDHQICTHHVQAMEVFRDELWLGGFREGVCVRRGDGFASVSAPFRLVNAMRSTAYGLFVAANEGLFVTTDGQRFERVAEVQNRGVNGLALSGDVLWVSAPTALIRLPLGDRVEEAARTDVEVLWTPGGSTAIQGLSVRGDQIWLASEDRGAIRVRRTRADGRARRRSAPVDGYEVDVFDALRGLDSSWVVDVAVDAQGTVFAATLRHGLFAIRPTGQVAKLALPSEWLLRLGFRDEQLWVGTQDGLVQRLALASGSELTLPGQCVHSLLGVGGAIWVGTEAGTFEYGAGTAASLRVGNHPPR